jgi:hypothetical protein
MGDAGSAVEGDGAIPQDDLVSVTDSMVPLTEIDRGAHP